MTHSPDTSSIVDSTTLIGDLELDFFDLMKSISEPSSKDYNRQHKPLTAIQGGTSTLKVAKGLKSCGHRKLTYKVFSKFLISPYLYFSEQRLVFVNSAGALTAPHLDYGFTSGFSTILAGKKLFKTFGVMEKNRRIMQHWQNKALSWEDAHHLMRELEQPQFNYLQMGKTIYLAAGQTYLVLSP